MVNPSILAEAPILTIFTTAPLLSRTYGSLHELRKGELSLEPALSSPRETPEPGLRALTMRLLCRTCGSFHELLVWKLDALDGITQARRHARSAAVVMTWASNRSVLITNDLNSALRDPTAAVITWASIESLNSRSHSAEAEFDHSGIIIGS